MERRHLYALGHRSWMYNFWRELEDSIRILDLLGMIGYVVDLVTVDDVEYRIVVHAKSTSLVAVA